VAGIFFGEPVLKISDLMRTARDGRGYICILAAQKLQVVIKASTVAGEYDETVDRESASEILQKRTSDARRCRCSGAAMPPRRKRPSDRAATGFGTTLGKTIIKSAVPAGTQIFENAIKRGAFEVKKHGGGGDGFTGIG
jgi:hypothetical protein